MATHSQRLSSSQIQRQNDHFDLFVDVDGPPAEKPLVPSELPGILEELAVQHCQNKSPNRGISRTTPREGTPGFDLVDCHEETSINSQINLKANRHRRPPIRLETFEPLEAVREDSTRDSSEDSVTADLPHLARRHLSTAASQDTLLRHHPLVTAEPNCPIREEIKKHLAGQFQWLISYAAPETSIGHHASPGHESDSGRGRGSKVYGCNLLSRKRRSTFTAQVGCSLANTYTLIATPLEEDVSLLPEVERPNSAADKPSMALPEPPSYYDMPPKVPEVVEVTSQTLSPPLSNIGERGSSIGEVSSRGGSFSLPRIEDSLEELDRLEEDLEAFNTVTNGRRVVSPARKTVVSSASPAASLKPAASKRLPIAGQSATVKAKSSDRTRPAIRRTASLLFREHGPDGPEPVVEQKADASLSHIRSSNLRSTPTRASVKSSKPPTVPNFELPGEAVSRRLKEQREARQAKQAEAQKTPVTLTRARSSKPLTKPTFELPGEAITRRRREEREARLKIQEEEERNRREFKARPMKPITAPSASVRETATSRARQNKSQLEANVKRQTEASQSKRMSLATSRPALQTNVTTGSPTLRGRKSMTLTSHDASRAASSSTGSISGKRHTLSAGEAAQLRLRGKDVFVRDNSVTQGRERERRDREAVAKLAREEAAERSRIASREWAEKRRQRGKEQVMREAMMANGL